MRNGNVTELVFENKNLSVRILGIQRVNFKFKRLCKLYLYKE